MGVRIIEENNPKYNPGSYHSGMVWPLFGGWAALSEFKTGNTLSGFQHIMNNLLVYRNWGLGSIEETLNGAKYIPNGVCSHQCWSETMVLQPAIEGMLGLEPDALQNKISLAPYFPWNWDFCNVNNIAMGQTRINLQMTRSSSHTSYSLHSNKSFTLRFSPSFPFNTNITRILLNGKLIPMHIIKTRGGVQVKIEQAIVAGITKIIIEHSGGLGALPIIAYPEPGDSSEGLQIIDEKISKNIYEITVQGDAGAEKELRIFTMQKILSADNAVITGTEKNQVFMKVQLPSSSAKKYVESIVKIAYEDY